MHIPSFISLRHHVTLALLMAGMLPLGAQTIFISEGFEPPSYVPGELHRQNEWNATSGVELVNGAGTNASVGLRFTGPGNELSASQDVDSTSLTPIPRVYKLAFDVRLGSGNFPSTVVHGSLTATYDDPDGAFGQGLGGAGLISYDGAVRIGYQTAFNANGEPTLGGETIGWSYDTSAPPLLFDTFYNIQLTYDLDAQRYDVAVDGVKVLLNVPMLFEGNYTDVRYFSLVMDDLSSDTTPLAGIADVDNVSFSAVAIPEPASAATLMGLTLLCFAALRRTAHRA